MPTVLVFQHNDHIPPGLLGEALERRGIEMQVAHLYDRDPVPDHFGFDGVASLGGVMGAYEEEDHPWLADEKRFLAGAAERGSPTLGLCLGCQMLADALGGSAYKGEAGEEIGLLDIGLNDAGRDDPVLRELDGPLPVFHGDTWDPPEGSTVVAATGRFLHGFRLGSVVAVQSHPEASCEITGVWIDRHPDRLIEAGVDPEILRAELRSGETALRAMSERFFGAWADEVTGRS